MVIKKTRFILATILLLTVAGCEENFLQTEPPGTVSSATYWQTEQDGRLAVNNLYSYLYGIENFSFDSMSDIGATDVSGFRGERESIVIRGEVTSDNPLVETHWERNFEGIRAVNDLLANIDQVENMDQNLRARYKAEARFIRAYLYTYMAILFGDVPLLTEPISIQQASKLTRTDRAAVWDFVNNELQSISPDLPISYSNPEDVGRITRGAALAMKARAMLFAGRYSVAAEAAQDVIDLGVYEIYPSYESLFSYQAENNTEVVLDKQFIKNDYSNGVFNILAPNSQNSSTSDLFPTQNLVDAYEMENGSAIDEAGSGFDPRNPYENRDPRLDYSVIVYGDTLPNGIVFDPRPGFGGPDDIEAGFQTSSTGFNVQKYINPEDLSDPTNSGINIILIRYAEVLLTYAEAKIELNEIDQSVYDAINDVRQRSDVNMSMIVAPKTQSELREIVRHERLVELAFEGLRFFDIRRWEIAPDVMNGRIYGMRYVDENGDLQTVEVSEYQRGFEAPKNYVLPIPQTELELNPDLEQNQGY